MRTLTLLRRLAGLAAGARGWLALSLAARLLGSSCAIALVAVPAWAVGVAASQDVAAPKLPQLAAWLLGLALLKAVLRYAEQYTGHHAAFTLLARLRLDFYDALVPQAPAIIATEGSGRLLSVATRDIDRMEVFFAHTIVPTITAVLIPCAATASIAVVAGPLPAVLSGLGFIVGGAVVPLLGSRRCAVSARTVLELRASVAQHVAENVAGLAELRSFGAEHERMRQLRILEGRIAEQLRRSGTVRGWRAAAGLAWPWVVVTALVGVASTGGAPLPAILTAAAVVLGTAPTLASVEALAQSLPLALAAGRRYLALCSRPPAVPDTGVVTLAGHDGRVSVAGVSVQYPGMAAAALTRLTVEIPDGGHVAIVGPSGVGKSTLAKLLVRELDPNEGQVRLGGVNIRTVPLAALRRHVSVVEQGAVLLSGSVLENLRLGNEHLTPADAWRALDQAHLGDHVRSTPAGLGAEIGPNGERLSGGQRQRLALARALARRPKVLILDEATSHQDPQTQSAIREATENLPDCTVLTIAHRRDAISAGSAVITLHGGGMVWRGPLR